jgi:hypothetical protein
MLPTSAYCGLTIQKELKTKKRGATVIPIILSSDKTQVTMFRNKSRYPVYMTIGNIPKEIHHGSFLHICQLQNSNTLPTRQLDVGLQLIYSMPACVIS